MDVVCPALLLSKQLHAYQPGCTDIVSVSTFNMLSYSPPIKYLDSSHGLETIKLEWLTRIHSGLAFANAFKLANIAQNRFINRMDFGIFKML